MKIPSASHGKFHEKSAESDSQAHGEMDVDEDPAKSAKSNERSKPRARCACQVVYNPNCETFYLHGGNAGQILRDASGGPRRDERLDDFWSMKLERPSKEEVIRRACFELRRQQ